MDSILQNDLHKASSSRPTDLKEFNLTNLSGKDDEFANECPDCVVAQLLYRQTRSQFNYIKPPGEKDICYTDHSTMSMFTSDKFRLLSMLCLTFFFFLVEIVVGYFTNSTALIADSFHMLSDVVALLIAFVSVRVSCHFVSLSHSFLIGSFFLSDHRCHRKSGQKTLLAGRVQKCWAH